MSGFSRLIPPDPVKTLEWPSDPSGNIFFATLLLGWWMDYEAGVLLSSAIMEGLGLLVLGVGYVGTILSTALGMQRRGIPGLWRVLPVIPFYWLMLSFAAWRALVQLLTDPQRWEKTEHGLASTSRRRLRLVRAGRPINSAANRRRRRPAAA